ncbi:unnamed protein product, partial [Ranitomeya imitator]
MLHEIDNDSRFLQKIVFSDEATFHICGHVHRHNFRIWAPEHPHAYIEYERNTPKVNMCQRRLLLRDTQLPHTWKDLWTMVHFLIPSLSRQYLDFPVKEGSEQDPEYRHTISIRLHRSAQPFILRRTKRDVERQLNKKSEHVLKCQLSNRQKIMYEDVMMQPGTQDSLKGGHFVSVLHVLTQLQRICNHPDLVDPRPQHSSYACDALQFKTASLVLQALEYDPWK